ncbi:acetolactate synthase 2 small subunit [Aeromonas media]|mgnify:FL=1|uniref:acetolactate synthase 2 small subunit n=1 Tax=Aeromonas media TaxID=651 RepID=UPI0002E42812|nr:acetolactate synthase 2 small subunit [Aeromonas media]AHX63002.1 acetolactate synthase II small subunit [Aeromonas media WS]MCY9823717.1 acetolactate synthase 2 small subunit [Aeromonas media]QQQ13724.1 acetolactate synthase 2 small subunit [Aeromonas media]
MKQHSFHQPGLAQHTLHIHAQPRPEVMERVLRVVRHRGFALCTLNMEQDCQQLRITVTVESERPIQQLWNQLVKLVDVSRVDALEQQPRISA